MLIEIHMIQNHSPANLNRDDLGAPKTCYFGGVLRSRISSQCIKRSIRFAPEFADLKGGIRTRRLAEKIEESLPDYAKKGAKKVLESCGLGLKKEKKKPAKPTTNDDTDSDDVQGKEETDMLVFTTYEALDRMVGVLADTNLDEKEKTERFKELLTECVHSPDMALCGRMLETKELNNTAVEAALQTAHAISTHAARPEIDYFVAADDVPGEDAGAGHIGEAMFSSACFYKYFSIDWEQLVKNLNGDDRLAAHTLGAFLLAAARTNPSGKQNSYAAHNFPDGILVEFKDTPVSYANAFARPIAVVKGSDIVEQSIGQLANYVLDIRNGYFDGPESVASYWFSPNRRFAFGEEKDKLAQEHIGNLKDLVRAMLKHVGGYDWEDVIQTKVNVGG
jgi:CRISPR system Cascade subunit CasC